MDLLNVELMKVIMSIVMIEADMITNVNIPETCCGNTNRKPEHNENSAGKGRRYRSSIESGTVKNASWFEEGYLLDRKWCKAPLKRLNSVWPQVEVSYNLQFLSLQSS